MAEDNSIGCGCFVLLLCIGIGVFLLKSHEEEVARENPYRWRGVGFPLWLVNASFVDKIEDKFGSIISSMENISPQPSFNIFECVSGKHISWWIDDQSKVFP